jgi:hypothetical protein
MTDTATHNVQENLARQLCESVDRLQKQAEKVEFWATALARLRNTIPKRPQWRAT